MNHDNCEEGQRVGCGKWQNMRGIVCDKRMHIGLKQAVYTVGRTPFFADVTLRLPIVVLRVSAS